MGKQDIVLSASKGGGGSSDGNVAECCYLAPVLLPLGLALLVSPR